MPAIHRLTDTQVRTSKKTLGDGGGLTLVVANGNRKWVFRYTLRGKARNKGLGAYPETSLAQARDLAAKCRALLKAGNDPLEQPRAEPEAEPKAPSFVTVAAAHIRAKRREWSNPKHARQWVATLKTYARPTIGKTPVDEITTEGILAILSPIWNTKTETAKRVQGRIENVLDFAIARGWRGDRFNPARWRGNLDMLLSSPAKVKRNANGGVTRHHPAMPFAEVPDFYAELCDREGIGALALRWLIVTATRTSETLGAQWGEIDLDARTWTIPAGRVKAKRQHRVPLSDEALAILRHLPRIEGEPWLFPGKKKGRPLANMALLMMMRRQGFGVGGDRGDYVPHGFRSSFRDWAGEVSSYPTNIAEAALAHVIGDKTESAYARGDLFDKRRQMMADWAHWCAGVA